MNQIIIRAMSLSIGDPFFEVKERYIYRDGNVYKKMKGTNDTQGKLMTKYYNPSKYPSKGYYWNLKNMRIYEDWAKENLT